VHTGPDGAEWVALTLEPLSVDAATTWATTPRCGAVTAFIGCVRDHAEGRDGVTGLAYEAYEDVALARLRDVAEEARRRWPVIERIALLHRLGELPLSEASVLVVVSAPHRAESFEAARFCIDTLKETVPIWKREHWRDGDGWATGARPLRPVREPARPARG
jgi:molybdopterin synthase catalytic subunit